METLDREKPRRGWGTSL